MNKMKEQRVLVLCSGGLDSVVLASMLDYQKESHGLLFVDYGQRAKDREELAVCQVSQYLQIPMITVRVPGAFQDASALVAGTTPDPGGQALAGQAAWVPARNLVLISLAAVQAVKFGFTELQIGNIGEGVYLDNKPEFTARFNTLLPWAVGPDKFLQLRAPLNLMSKTEVIYAGTLHQAPFELSWSCFRDEVIHCGTCASCIGRQRAFINMGYHDPVPYAK